MNMNKLIDGNKYIIEYMNKWMNITSGNWYMPEKWPNINKKYKKNINWFVGEGINARINWWMSKIKDINLLHE